VPSDQRSASSAGKLKDAWSDWLLSRRQGGQEPQPDQRAELLRYRDGVLAGAELQPGDVLLDVGCGDGLIGFGACEALGQTGRVVFSDVSAELLQRCEQRAAEMGLSHRCSFVEARAENLAGLADRSIDVVTTRSVLIYVDRKREAFAEFFRVLRPGGRLSLFEPINRRTYPEPSSVFWGWDVSTVTELRDKVAAEFGRGPAQERRAMMDFDENDLVRLAEEVGFADVELLLHVAISRPPQRDWDRLLQSSPNPLAPTLAEAVAASLNDREAGTFLTALRASVQARAGRRRSAVAYVHARKR
jgi:arsenite methyltransferase